jgi:HEAT repeat protein
VKAERLAELQQKAVDAAPLVRADAAKALGRSRSPAALALLTRLLGDSDHWVRAAAIDSVARLNHSPAAAVVISSLSDEDDWVRTRAAVALGDMAVVEAAPALVHGLSDAKENVRAMSAKALGVIRHLGAEPDLTARLNDIDSGVVYWAAWALGELGTRTAAEVLVRQAGRDAVLQGAFEFFVRRAERRVEHLMIAFIDREYSVQREATIALCSGHPPLVAAADRWTQRTCRMLKLQPTPIRWGEAST